MDKNKFSAIAHRTHAYCNPFSVEKLERVFDVIALGAGSRVVDFGCGKAELLIRLVERFNVSAVGIDLSAMMVAEARERVTARVPKGRVELHELPASSFEGETGAFDLAVCVGSTHVFGGYEPTLDALRKWVKPGGHVLVGEGFWRRKPDPAYLDALGCAEGDYSSHAENVFRAEQRGLIPCYAAQSTDEEWDEYEWRYSRAVEQYVREHPSDPDAPAMLDRSRKWRSLYLKLGRDNLGFGLYVFRC